MVKPIQRTEIKGFAKGLFTDANPLDGQVDSTVDESNFEIHRGGTRSRRLGFDIEVGGFSFELNADQTELTRSASTTFLWEGANGDPNHKFVVLQFGSRIYFFTQVEGFQRMQLLQTLDIPQITKGETVSFAVVEGYLGITNGTSEIGLVEYIETTRRFEYSTFRLKIRDLFGIEETIDPRFEQDALYRGPLNWQHYYNLYNQGWAIPRKDWVFGNPPLYDAVLLGSNKNPAVRSPSNADVVWTGLDNKPEEETSLESFEAFHYRQFEAVTGADGKAAKGFFIIDAFNRGSSRYENWVAHKAKHPEVGNLVSGFSPLPDATSGGPSVVASHAGRLFYSGCKGVVTGADARSPNYNNYVFFSQLVKSKTDFGKCYQEGDPTSREGSDIVDTDGGFFIVSEAINIHTMYSMGDRLVLIAENGVWTVTGGSGYGFSGTNYKVEKMSTFGGIPNKSFVEFGGRGFFWGWDGIYTIGRNEYGDYSVDNATLNTIDKFYANITNQSKVICQGFVDKARRQVRWVYTEGNPFTEDAESRELIFDFDNKSFISFRIAKHPTRAAYVLGGVQLGEFTTQYTYEQVVADANFVYVGDNLLGVDVPFKVAVDSTVKYLAIHADEVGQLRVSFCEYNNMYFEDWGFTGYPVDAFAFMQTNAFTGDDVAIKKQVPYLVMAFAETEKRLTPEGVTQESSCIGRFMWNFAHLERSGKWGREQQLYRKNRWYFNDSDVDNGFDVNITKTKIRGSGRAFALQVETEPRKDCHIYGWNLSLTANGVT